VFGEYVPLAFSIIAPWVSLAPAPRTFGFLYASYIVGVKSLPVDLSLTPI